MKKLLNWYTIIMLVAVVSCNKSDDDTPADDQSGYADHTVIMYGCGGGDLDESLILNLSEVAEYGYSEDVKFTALLKFSQEYQDQYPGTRQITLVEDGLTDVSYDDASFELNNPENLGKFIGEVKANMPAKKYTLILWNHGSTFCSSDLPYSMTKAVCFDDNNGDAALSIFDIEDGLKIAGGVDLVYFDVCLMNMIENVYQLRDQTDYVLGASHLTSGLGGNYIELMDALDNNEDIVEAMTTYVPKTGEMWRLIEGTDSGFDLTLTDVSYMEQIAEYITKYADELIEIREEFETNEQDELEFYYYNGDSSENAEEYFDNPENFEYPYYYSEGGVLYTYPCSKYSVDLIDAFAGLAYSNTLTSTTIAIKYLLDRAIVVNTTNIQSGATCDYFSLGICWASADDYNDDSYGVALADVYSLLDFENATNWSRFLEGNKMRPVTYDEELEEYVEL